MLAHLLAAAIGTWLMAAPAVLGYGDTSADVARVIGPLIASFGLLAAWGVTRSARWANVLLAAALSAAPLFVDHSSAAALNHMASGVLVLVLSLVRGKLHHPFGGGWRALRRRLA